MDGLSLAPVLAGHPLDADRTLFFAHVEGRGVRQGPWKASKLATHGWELFDLDEDPGETHDLSGQKPQVLDSLVDELVAWRHDVSQERQRREAATSVHTQGGPAADGQ